jgi:hypothetical protein
VSNVTPRGTDIETVARQAAITTGDAARAVRAGVTEALDRGLDLEAVTIVLTPTRRNGTEMTGQIENAAGVRGLGTFPAEWGIPRGAQYSEERAAWVRRNVRVEQVRNLDRNAKRQTMSAQLALAKALALS